MIVSTFAKTFDWAGRATRREALIFVAFVLLACAGAVAVDHALDRGQVFVPRLVYLVAGLQLPALVAVLLRRAHDAGFSGRWLVLMLLPAAGFFLLLFLLAAPSRRRGRHSEAGTAGLAIGAALTLGTTLLCISRLVWAPYWASSASMAPTILPGDYFAVARPFGYAPARGDIIVFRDRAQHADVTKRVVGLPGDRAQMKDGFLYLNDVAVLQTDAGNFTQIMAPQGPAQTLPRCSNAPVGLGGACITARKTEVLPNGAAHDILDIGATPGDNTPVFTVPEGQYFVLGDNRDNSLDSRIAADLGGGFVPANRIIGSADRVLFSATGASLAYVWTWRAGRFLKALQ